MVTQRKQPPSTQVVRRDRLQPVVDNVVEEASEESFPASDAPAWGPVTSLGPPCPAPAPPRRERGSSRARAEQDAISLAIRRVESVVAALVPGQEHAGRQPVAADLAAVSEALVRHVAAAEGAEGLFSVVDRTRPTLLRRLDHLRDEHFGLLQQTEQLRRQLQAKPQDDSALRQRAAALLTALQSHQQAEAELLLESVDTDLGAGD